MKIELQKKAYEAYLFLNDHPAFCGDAFGYTGIFPNSYFNLSEVCKNGYCKNDCIRILKSDENSIKYKDTFEENYQTSYDNIDESDEIYLSYEEYYGYEWAFDRYEYIMECTVHIYIGDDPWDALKCIGYTNWISYVGKQSRSNSFEECIIDLAEIVKARYGNFSLRDFYLPEELENNENEEFMSLESEDHKVIFNKNYINVTDAVLNQRWLRWYIEQSEENKEEYSKYLREI